MRIFVRIFVRIFMRIFFQLNRAPGRITKTKKGMTDSFGAWDGSWDFGSLDGEFDLERVKRQRPKGDWKPSICKGRHQALLFTDYS